MKFGLTLGVDVPPDPNDLVSVVSTAADLGFESFWLGDHVIIPRSVDHATHGREVGGKTRIADKTTLDVFEPIVTMTYLAARVERIRLGFSVLVIPYRNPVLCAKMLATLDVLSAGRLMLGAGVGWMQGEFQALNASYADRGATTDEYLKLMVTAWTQDHPEFHGQFYDLPDIAFRPKPLQKPHLPIYIGGNSDRALRRAAELGNGWLPLFQSPEELRPKLRTLAALCEQHGRSDDEMRIVASVRVRLGDHDENTESLSSNADQVAELAHRYADAGVDELTLVIVEPDLKLEQLHDKISWFSQDVMPQV